MLTEAQFRLTREPLPAAQTILPTWRRIAFECAVAVAVILILASTLYAIGRL